MSQSSAGAAPAVAASGRSNLTGIAAFLIGLAFFVGNDFIAKLMGDTLPPGEIVALRGAVVSVLVLIAGLWTGAFRGPIRPRLTLPFCIRPFTDLAATLTFVASMMHMEFADAIGVQQVQPLLVTAASALWLGERVGWRRWLATAAGLIGVLLILKPGTGAFGPYALLALLCALFAVTSDLTTRIASQTMPTLFLALPSAVVVTLGGCLLGLTETWKMPSPLVMLGVVVTGALVFAGLLLVVAAIRNAELSVLAPLRYVAVIQAVVLQIALWGVVPDLWTTAGLVLVVGAGLYTIHRERVRARGAA